MSSTSVRLSINARRALLRLAAVWHKDSLDELYQYLYLQPVPATFPATDPDRHCRQHVLDDLRELLPQRYAAPFFTYMMPLILRYLLPADDHIITVAGARILLTNSTYSGPF